MAYGTPGDHPVTDIVLHGQRVYSEEIDAMIVQIAKLAGIQRLLDEFRWLPEPPQDFAHRLRALRNELKARKRRTHAG
ncbi:MAG TPA: hypothetical protein VGB20_07235 [bacterium]